MRLAIRAFCLSVLALLSAAPTLAGEPGEGIQELEEIWVHGKKLSLSIVDAEDAFFKLYNKINKNSAYDVYCGTMSLSRGSMIMIRKCIPGFIVFNSYDPITNTVSMGQQCGGGSSTYTESSGDRYYMSSCVGASMSYTSPPPSLLLMERGPAYARNVDTVVRSDPRLIKMANDLGAMYDELDAAQHRYVRVKQANAPPPRVRQPARNYKGPRAPM